MECHQWAPNPTLATTKGLSLLGIDFTVPLRHPMSQSLSHFPRGVFYQRYVNINGVVRGNFYPLANGTLDDGAGPPPMPSPNPPVNISIDPYFFSVAAV